MKISSVSEDLEKEYPHLLLVNTEIKRILKILVVAIKIHNAQSFNLAIPANMHIYMCLL